MRSSQNHDRRDYPNIGDNPDGVIPSPYPRKVQDRGKYEISLVKDWARLLRINKQGEPIDQKLITGDKPVVIDEPAIIIRPHPNGGGRDE